MRIKAEKGYSCDLLRTFQIIPNLFSFLAQNHLQRIKKKRERKKKIKEEIFFPTLRLNTDKSIMNRHNKQFVSEEKNLLLRLIWILFLLLFRCLRLTCWCCFSLHCTVIAIWWIISNVRVWWWTFKCIGLLRIRNNTKMLI